MYAKLKLSYFPFLNGNKLNDAAAFIKYGDCALQNNKFSLASRNIVEKVRLQLYP